MNRSDLSCEEKDHLDKPLGIREIVPNPLNPATTTVLRGIIARNPLPISGTLYKLFMNIFVFLLVCHCLFVFLVYWGSIWSSFVEWWTEIGTVSGVVDLIPLFHNIFKTFFIYCTNLATITLNAIDFTVERVYNSLLQLCLDDKVTSIPHSLTRPSTFNEAQFTKNNLGDYFMYIERSGAAEKLFSSLKNQYYVKCDALRGSNGRIDAWEYFKREISIPVMHGLSGCGKSRFARDAITCYTKKLLSTSNIDPVNMQFAELMADEEHVGHFYLGK